jgi:hypothetical protein
VVRPEDVLNEATIHVVPHLSHVFGIDKKALTADGAADAGGELRWLA